MHLSASCLLSLALLSACTALVPSGVARLAALSPLDADPARFAVALVLPEGLSLAPSSARLSISATREDTGATASGDFALAAQGSAPAAFGADSGEVRLLSVAPGDIGAMRALQRQITGWKASGAETHDLRSPSGLQGAGAARGPPPMRAPRSMCGPKRAAAFSRS